MTGVMWISFIFVSVFQVYLFWQGIDLVRKFLNFAGPAVYVVMILLMIRRPPRSTQSRSSAASDVYKRQYQNIATRPLAIAGKFAPKTPILTLANTGYGIPCITLGLPERLTSHIIKNPAKIKARNTAQPFNPEAINNDAAKVYPNKL